MNNKVQNLSIYNNKGKHKNKKIKSKNNNNKILKVIIMNNQISKQVVHKYNNSNRIPISNRNNKFKTNSKKTK